MQPLSAMAVAKVWLAAAAAAAYVRASTASSCVGPTLSDPEFMSMYDASGHRTFDAGNWDNCLALPNTQHCLLFPQLVGIGMCVPSNCSEADLSNASAPIMDYVFLAAPVVLVLVSDGVPLTAYCGDHSVAMGSQAATVVGVSAAWAALLLAATAYTVYCATGAGEGKGANRKAASASGKPAAQQPGTLMRVVEAMSLTRSIPALLRTSGERSGTFGPLNGVRVLSMCLVILGHTVLMQQQPGVTNISFFGDNMKRWAFQIIPSAEFAVDSFLTLSGFLAAFSLYKQLTKHRKQHPPAAADPGLYGKGDATQPLLSVNDVEAGGNTVPTQERPQKRSILDNARKTASLLGYYVLHRIWRLNPLLGYVMAFSTFVVPLFTSGPFWFYYNLAMVQNCMQYWWTPFIFVNDFVPADNNFNQQCMPWVWYLGVDSIMYLVCPFIVFAFEWRRWAGWGVLSTLLAATLITAEEISRQKDISALINIDEDRHPTGDYQNDFYTKPWTRAPAYLLGIALAFAVTTVEQAAKHTREHNSVEAAENDLNGNGTRSDAGEERSDPLAPSWRHRRQQVRHVLRHNGLHLLLLLAFVLMGVLYYVPVDNYQSQWGLPGTIIFTAFGRPLWSLGLTVMLFWCFTYPQSLLSRFLAAPIFEPLARITYGAYLVHPVVIAVFYYSRTAVFRFDSLEIAAWYLSHTCISFAIAGVLFVAIEYPLGSLEKIVLGRGE